MKALMYLGPEKLELQEVPKATGDIVIRVIASGVCGTDLKTFLHGHPMFKPPTVLGHECYGEIVELNKELPGLKVGDIVAVAPYLECGECDLCRAGVPELCKDKTFVETGCFSEYISMSVEHALKALFPIDSPSDVYTLVEPLACVLNGVEKLGAKTGNTLIVGGGPMGTLFALTMKAMGKETTVIETSDWRLEFLKNAGIDAMKPADLNASGFDSVILAVNNPDIVPDYMSRVGNGGNLLLFAGYPSKTTLNLDPYLIHYKEVSVMGSFGFGKKHFVDAVDFINKNPKNYESLITGSFSLEEGENAFELLRQGKSMKAIIRMW